MLRMGYMPSDLNPMVLMIGAAEDLSQLIGCLSAFAEDGDDRRLCADCGVGMQGTEVVLTDAPEGRIGLFADADGALAWRLTRADAAAFADEVAGLACADAPSGSVTLECDRLGEIRVKVSIGEWEDSVLAFGI